MTGKERFARILKHQPVDRIGLFEVYWRETAVKWAAEGHFAKPEDISDHLGLDVRRMQPIEAKAGMDLLRIKKNFGDKIALIGGIDERVLETNDLKAVERELAAKLPGAMADSGYVLQVDHSVSHLVEYDTYRFFVERGLEMGTYK